MLFQIVQNSLNKAKSHCAWADGDKNMKYAEELFAGIEKELCIRLGIDFHWNLVLAQADYNKIRDVN